MSLNPEEIILLDLLDKGAVELTGMDEDGEPTYRFTEKLKDVNPELYNLHVSMLNTEVMALWEKGFVDMNMFEENPTVYLTKKAFIRNEVAKLNPQLQGFVKELKRMFKQDGTMSM